MFEHSLVFKHNNLACVQTQRLVFEHKAVCVTVFSLCLAVFRLCLAVFSMCLAVFTQNTLNALI